MAIQAERPNIANNEHLQKKSTASANEAHKAAGDSEKSLESEQLSLKETKKYLQTVTGDCGLKSSDFASRQNSRQAEIDSIGQAIGLLTGTAMQAGATHLNRAQTVGGLLQKRAFTVRKVTLGCASKGAISHKYKQKNYDNNVKIASFLRESAVKLHSNTIMPTR